MLVISLVLKFLEQLFVIKIGTLQHQVVQSWVKITRFSVKSDLRSESFKIKFSTIPFVYYLMTGYQSENRENVLKKAFE